MILSATDVAVESQSKRALNRKRNLRYWSTNIKSFTYIYNIHTGVLAAEASYTVIARQYELRI